MRRLTPALLALALVSLLGFPALAAAQEEEEAPPVLRLSFFKCDFAGGAGDRIDDELENRDIPIWKELMSEGKIIDHGYFYHWWADEWNLGVYTIGASIPALIEAVGAAAERYEQRHGDADTEVAKACPEHKDGFYTLGPSASGPAQAAN